MWRGVLKKEEGTNGPQQAPGHGRVRSQKIIRNELFSMTFYFFLRINIFSKLFNVFTFLFVVRLENAWLEEVDFEQFRSDGGKVVQGSAYADNDEFEKFKGAVANIAHFHLKNMLVRRLAGTHHK